jgi:hypothetical protein
MKMSNELKEENRKLRNLRLLIDLTIQLLYQKQDLTLTEGLNYLKTAKKYAVSLFPDKGEVFDLIYRPRLLRVISERGLLN